MILTNLSNTVSNMPKRKSKELRISKAKSKPHKRTIARRKKKKRIERNKRSNKKQSEARAKKRKEKENIKQKEASTKTLTKLTIARRQGLEFFYK